MRFKVCGIQMGPYKGDYDRHMGQALQVLELARTQENPYVAVFPEMMTGPYFCPVIDDKFFDLAEPLNGRTVRLMTQKSKECGLHIVGSFFETAVENGNSNYYNSAFLCSPTRGLVGVYRKVHLPKVDTASITTDEKYYFERFGGGGKAFPVFELDNGVRVGILICFDRSFPEAWRQLMLQGAQIVFVPVCTYGFRDALFIPELQVRAMENRVFAVGVNKAGAEIIAGEKKHRNHFGKSCVIDPNGDVLAAVGKDPWAYVAGEIDIRKIAAAKKAIDWQAERKPHLYRCGGP